MNIIYLAVVVSIFFMLMLLALWWAVRHLIRELRQEMRWQREVLVKEVNVELIGLEGRLAARLTRQ